MGERRQITWGAEGPLDASLHSLRVRNHLRRSGATLQIATQLYLLFTSRHTMQFPSRHTRMQLCSLS